MEPKIKSVLENIAMKWGFPPVSYAGFVSNGKLISCFEKEGAIKISRTGDFKGTRTTVNGIVALLEENGYQVDPPDFTEAKITLDCTIRYKKQK